MFEKIQKLFTFLKGNRADEQDLNTVSYWEEEAKRLFLINSLKNHDGIKYVLEIFKNEVEKINDSLLNQRQMFEDERYRLLDQRALAQKYLDLFANTENDLDKLEKTLDEELSKVK